MYVIMIALCSPVVLTHRKRVNADKMLKERFLNRDEEVIEEEFTDDEESEDEADGTGKCFIACFLSLCTIPDEIARTNLVHVYYFRAK